MSEPEKDDEFYGDALLRLYGYSGEVSAYKLRLRRQRELAEVGAGPLAAMRRDLYKMGYRPRPRWPKLTTAWNEEWTPEWRAAMEQFEREQARPNAKGRKRA